jgi:ADP-ribosyl-[dinitrogen reductase] hydrolase
MLIEIAQGDAYGAGFEFCNKLIICRDHDMTKYHDSREDNIRAGQYTDDTQMTLAISELVLKEDNWDHDLISEYFIRSFKRDEREGYASGFYSLLMEVNSGKEFNEKILNSSIRNGAAMRSVPIGLYSDKENLLNKAKMQAEVTHDTEEGIYSSQVVALAAHYFIYNLGKKDGLQSFLENELGRKINNKKETQCECDAIDTIDAVITVLENSTSLYEIIDKSVRLGGDTDSVASIACGIASFSDEFDKKLPDFFLDDLEDGVYGKKYLLSLDKLLMEKYLS